MNRKIGNLETTVLHHEETEAAQTDHCAYSTGVAKKWSHIIVGKHIISAFILQLYIHNYYNNLLLVYIKTRPPQKKVASVSVLRMILREANVI